MLVYNFDFGTQERDRSCMVVWEQQPGIGATKTTENKGKTGGGGKGIVRRTWQAPPPDPSPPSLESLARRWPVKT